MGGAHRAAAAYLLDHGVNELVSVSRKENNPPAFPGSCERVAGYDVLEREGGALLVNATPVGMYPRARVSPVGPEVVSRFDCVADLIYNPLTTRLMEYARQQGKGCCNGLFMLVAQAVKAQEIWLGRTIGQQAEENIYHSLLKTLKEETGHGA